MDGDRSIPGVRRLLGAGIYTSVPALPAALRDRVAIVGAAVEVADALLRLADWCLSVIVIKPNRTGIAALRGRRNVTILHGTEIVCVDGIEQVECVVVRKISTGAISAYQVSALILLPQDGSIAGSFKNSVRFVQSHRATSLYLEHIAESRKE